MTRKGYWLTITTSIVVVLLLALGGYFGYVSYKTHRYNELGDASIKNGDWGLARFWYSKALEIDAENIYALSKLSRFSSFYRDPNTMTWWRQNAKVQPNSEKVALGFAEALLRNNQLDEAKLQLDKLDPLEEDTARYNNLLTAYYIAKQDYPHAESFARKSIQESPDSIELKLNLLNILLLAGNPESRDEVNELLTTLSASEENLPGVWRILLGYSMGRKNWKESLGIAEKLANHPEAKWFERAAYLKLIIKFEPNKLNTYLSSIQDPEPLLIEETCKLLSKIGRTQDSLVWLKELENSEVAETLSYQISKADAHASLKQWTVLLGYLQDSDWQYFDYYRQLLLSRGYRSTGKDLECNKAWLEATKAAGRSSITEQNRLATIVESWPEFQPEWLELVEDMLNDSVHTAWAYSKLQTHYFQMGATQELYRISRKANRNLPKDSGIENNLIMQALLLDIEPERQLEAAQNLRERYNGKPIPTSTCAFALYKNGMLEEAYNLLKTLDERYFDIAEMAHYAAVISAGAGHKEESHQYLVKAEKATLLPEERALLKN